jgi:molybdopterin/thiamine biosynthesis adenylyltransferase
MATDRYTERARTFAHLAELADAPGATISTRPVLRIAVGADALATRAGQLLAITTTNLGARLCDQIDFAIGAANVGGGVLALLGNDSLGAESLIALADRIWKGTYTASSDVRPDLVIGIGAVMEPVDLGLGIDPDGAAVVMRARAVPIARPDAAIAAMVGAAVGVAQAAKLLYPAIVRGRVNDVVRFGLGPLGARLDPRTYEVEGRPVVAGVGAIGSAFLYALIGAEARADIVLVDPDGVNDRDLVRYVLFDDRHIGRAKVMAAAELARTVGIKVDPHQAVVSGYLDVNPIHRVSAELILSLVDSYEQRRSIAGELPRRILNAGTGDRDLTISRHGLADGFACLACLYPTRKIDVSREAVIGRELHLDVDEVRERLISKRLMSLDDVRRIAIAQGKDATVYDEFAGDPLDSFYRRACGTSAITLDRTGEAFAPITFLPALAGFLVASALFSDSGAHRHFRVDAFDGLESARRRSWPPRSGCEVCGKPAFVSAYRSKWTDRS